MNGRRRATASTMLYLAASCILIWAIGWSTKSKPRNRLDLATRVRVVVDTDPNGLPIGREVFVTDRRIVRRLAAYFPNAGVRRQEYSQLLSGVFLRLTFYFTDGSKLILESDYEAHWDSAMGTRHWWHTRPGLADYLNEHVVSMKPRMAEDELTAKILRAMRAEMAGDEPVKNEDHNRSH